MSQPTIDEVVDALLSSGPDYRCFLANRIRKHGIAPPDGLELIADIEGIGCCTVTIRNGRVYIAAVTVRDIISMGAGNSAAPDGYEKLKVFAADMAQSALDSDAMDISDVLQCAHDAGVLVEKDDGSGLILAPFLAAPKPEVQS